LQLLHTISPYSCNRENNCAAPLVILVTYAAIINYKNCNWLYSCSIPTRENAPFHDLGFAARESAFGSVQTTIRLPASATCNTRAIERFRLQFWHRMQVDTLRSICTLQQKRWRHGRHGLGFATREWVVVGKGADEDPTGPQLRRPTTHERVEFWHARMGKWDWFLWRRWKAMPVGKVLLW
jgi:hypothetical protein